MVDEQMDSVACEQRKKLEAVEGELAEVRRRLDRLWNAVETSDLEINDITPRVREHRERQERLEVAAEEARAALSEGRVKLDDAKTIGAFAQDMSRFLRESDFTETRSFISSFVKEITVGPGKATIPYAIPMPQDSPIGGGDAEEVALRGAGSVYSNIWYPW